ncbi:fimbria/pilus outer membrane usher protein [Pseudomonas sp. NCHU5208]|uniref:fimbria/pilus outer membrane usher protein n=1 Tax=unclassified Pseudomonas TaxID=196821 RepID=UPI003F959D17
MLLLFILLLCTSARGDEQAPEHLLYLELVINELPSGKVVEVRQRQDRLWLQRDELTAIGVPLPAESNEWIALDSIDALHSQYQQDTQRLRLTLPSEWLPHQRFGPQSLSEPMPAQSSLGLLFNYDLYYNHSENAAHYANAWLEQRAFDGFGMISNTGVYRHSFAGPGYRDGYTRYDTTWRFNDQQRMIGLTGGDLITGALTWNNAVRLGGIQIARDFSLRPDLITYPLPRFAGDAAVPSTLDLFIDNARIGQQDLRPGPFTLNTVPYISGAGTATLVTTDVLGRQVTTTVPFYVTDTLLRKGLMDYSASLGKLRRNYGVDDFAYGQLVGSGSLRYGLSDQLTLESHLEGGAGLRQAGIGGTVGLGLFGTLSTSLSQSSGIGNGQQYSLGYSYYARRFGITAQRIQRTRDYADLSVAYALDNGLAGTLLSKYQDQLTFSFSPERLGSFGIGYFASEAHNGRRTRLLNLSWSRGLWGSSSVYLSFNRQLDDGSHSIQAQLVIPFDLHASMTTAVERTSSGDQRVRANYSRNPPSEGGLGWNLGYADGASQYRQADLTWRARHAQVQLGAYQDDGLTTHWGGVSGSLVAMEGKAFASNRIDDAFVLVSTNGQADVPVRYEHQLLGRTDADGYLLVPWVPSYYPGQYELDLLDLPSNLQLAETQKRIAVHKGSGALLAFPMLMTLSASIQLVDDQGQPLPRGSQVTHHPSEQRTYIGWDGQLYLEGLSGENRLDVQLPNAAPCSTTFSLDETATEMAVLGPLTCTARAGAMP